MTTATFTGTNLPAADPRIARLLINNQARATGRGLEEVAVEDPLRTWGYTGAARILDTSHHNVRHAWQDDLRTGMSRALPQPDVVITRIIARSDGRTVPEVLPGWVEETLRDWAKPTEASVPTFTPPAGSAPLDLTRLPSIDPRIKTLFLNNLADVISSEGMATVLDEMAGQNEEAAELGQPEVAYPAPRTLCAYGYTGAAVIMGVSHHAVRHYWLTDLERGYSQGMPVPDVVINRIIVRAVGGEDIEVLPGWTERTLREWMPTRIGTGNHTRGADRRGNRNGRTGWRKNPVSS